MRMKIEIFPSPYKCNKIQSIKFAEVLKYTKVSFMAVLNW
jgi:hypothetical protein